MRGMQPDDVYRLTGAVDPRLSPDGATVAYVQTWVDEDEHDRRSAIWAAPADGSAPPRRLTFGGTRDGSPRWSPDGRWLAFTSARGDDPAQLFVLPVDGPGESRQLTSLKGGGIDGVDWSPDSSRLAFVARAHDPADDIEDVAKRPPRRVTRLQFRLDNEGWTQGRTHHLYTVGLDGAGARAADRRRRGGPDAGLVARRRHDRVRVGPSRGLGPRDRLRHLHDRRARRRAGARHPDRRRESRARVVARGRPDRTRVHPGGVRRSAARQDRGRRPRIRGSHRVDRVARSQRGAVPRDARADLGRRSHRVPGRGCGEGALVRGVGGRIGAGRATRGSGGHAVRVRSARRSPRVRGLDADEPVGGVRGRPARDRRRLRLPGRGHACRAGAVRRDRARRGGGPGLGDPAPGVRSRSRSTRRSSTSTAVRSPSTASASSTSSRWRRAPGTSCCSRTREAPRATRRNGAGRSVARSRVGQVGGRSTTTI